MLNELISLDVTELLRKGVGGTKALCTAGLCVPREDRLAHTRLATSPQAGFQPLYYIYDLCLLQTSIELGFVEQTRTLSAFPPTVWTLSLVWTHISFRTLFSNM